jgi:hypothetical protein
VEGEVAPDHRAAAQAGPAALGARRYGRYGSDGGEGGVGTAEAAVDTAAWTVLGALETVL